MTGHWGDDPGDDATRERMARHLAWQADLDPLKYVRLDTGEIRPVGGNHDNADEDPDGGH